MTENKDNIINDRYKKIETLIEKIEKAPEAISIFNDRLFDQDKSKIIKPTRLEKISNTLIDFADNLIKVNEPKISWLKAIARKTTRPLNFPYFLWKQPSRKSTSHYITASGIHYIYALPGGGKSSLLYDIFEEIRIETGLGSYINASLEIPRYDDVTDTHYRYHPQFRVEEFFGKVFNEKTGKYKIQQLQSFDYRFKNIGFDELLSWLNHRLNNTGDYLEVFIALIEFLAQRRHRHIHRAYFLNQLDTTDIQLMSAFNYIHEVRIDLDISYDDWIKTGQYNRHIRGWWIDTYTHGKTGKKTADNRLLIESHYRVRTADFTYFESLSQQGKYNMLPTHKIEGIHKGE